MSEVGSFFDGMTAFEIVEITYMQREAMFMDMSIFITILSGFLILVYLVGSRLDRTEAIAVTSIYIAFSLHIVFDFSQIAYRHLLVNSYMSGSEPNYVLHVFPSTLMLLGLILSVWYMFRKRRNATQQRVAADA